MLKRPIKHLTASLFVVAMISFAAGALAHDTNYAAIKISRSSSNAWTFELQTPLHGLDNAMRRFNDERSHNMANVIAGGTQYKELIVEYVKATFEIDSGSAGDDQSQSSNPVLGPGKIKLGDHVSQLIFDIENMPQTLEHVTLRLPYMANNPGQHNILWLIDGERRERHILGESNDFSLSETDFFDAVSQR